MNIFKAIGMVIASSVAVLTKGLKACENVAEMAELTTGSMLEEQKIEAETNIIELQQRRDEIANQAKSTAKKTKAA